VWSIYRLSVRTQLLLLLAAALLPVLGVLFFHLLHDRQEARDFAYGRVRILAQNTAASLDNLLRDHESVLQRIARRPKVMELDAGACDPIIAEFVSLYPEFTNLVVQDLAGRNDCSFLAQKISNEQLRAVPGFLQARTADGMTVGGVALGPLSGRWIASLFYPVKDARGQTTGIVSLPMDLQPLGERLFAGVPQGALVVVVDRDGRIVMRSQEGSDWMGVPVPGPMAHLMQAPQTEAALAASADGQERLFAMAAVECSGWTVLAGVPTADVFAESNTSFRNGSLLVLGFLALALAMAWRIARHIVRPVDALHRAAADVAAGHTGIRVHMDSGPRELAAVARQFNQMLDNREHALQELGASEARFRTLADLSADWYWEQDREHRITRVDGRVEEATGLPAEVYAGRSPWELEALNLSPEDWSRHRAGLDAREPFRNFEIERRDAQGRIRWGAVSGTPVFDAQGQFLGYRGVGRDITEARRLEQERLALSLHNEELSRRLVQSQEEIRRRFSRELHDRTSPNLAALRVNLDMLNRATPKERSAPEYQERVEDMRALIEDTTISVREICAELHPPVLDRGGLLAVVRSYAEQFARRTGLLVQVLCDHGEVRLSADLELALFRIVQEALTNSAKHAHAREITVQMQLEGPPLTLCITDDGIGFDVGQVARERRTGGLGLINMRETAEFAGGRFSLHTAPGEGTRICVEI
jgi:PAS domain S-box-containing protein